MLDSSAALPGLATVDGGGADKETNALELELLNSEASVFEVAVGSEDGFEGNGEENNEEENAFWVTI